MLLPVLMIRHPGPSIPPAKRTLGLTPKLEMLVVQQPAPQHLSRRTAAEQAGRANAVEDLADRTPLAGGNSWVEWRELGLEARLARGRGHSS
jgi:hypothetical protein